MRPCTLAFLCCVTASSVVPVHSACAAPDSPATDQRRAEELFGQGNAAMAKTPPDLDAACSAYHESFALGSRSDPRKVLGALMKEASCEDARRKLATSLALWHRVIELAQDDDKRSEATQQVASLEGRVGKLLLKLAPGAGAVVATVDGQPWPTGEAKPIDAGAHSVVVKAGESPSGSVTAAVTDGKTTEQVVPMSVSVPSAKAEVEPPVEPPPNSKVPLRAAGIALAAVGGAGIVGFAVTGGLSLAARGELRNACTQHDKSPYSGCNADASSIASRGKALNVANAVTLSIGVAAAVAAIPLLVVGSSGGSKSHAAFAPWTDGRSGGLIAVGSF